MAYNMYWCVALTGGSNGALDKIDGSVLSDGDAAIVIDAVNNLSYFYTLNASSGAAESSPDIISPDTNAGNKRWELAGVYTGSFTDNMLLRANGTNGIQDSGITVDDSDNITTPGFVFPASLKIGAATITVTDILDEDDMASDSATKLATQQSIKAYVDSKTGWTYAAQIATTSGTSVELINNLPSNVIDIEILLNGVSTDTDNQGLIIQIGDSGGYETSGYESAATVFTSGSLGTEGSTAGFLATKSAYFDAVSTISGILQLKRWDSSEHLWIYNGNIYLSSTVQHYSNGIKTLTGSITSVKLTTVGGTANFDGGEARVRYKS